MGRFRLLKRSTHMVVLSLDMNISSTFNAADLLEYHPPN